MKTQVDVPMNLTNFKNRFLRKKNSSSVLEGGRCVCAFRLKAPYLKINSYFVVLLLWTRSLPEVCSIIKLSVRQ